MEYVKKGIELEFAEDFRIYSAMKHETLSLLVDYVEKITNPEKYSELEVAVAVSAFEERKQFWKEFFTNRANSKLV